MEGLSKPEIWIGLVTLIALEIVLGIDNIVFISILASKLPDRQQTRARRIGLSLAMLTRIGLLFSLSWVIGLTAPLFTVLNQDVSGRDLILIGGGLFLLAKSTREIHDRLEGEKEGHAGAKVMPSFGAVIAQILDVLKKSSPLFYLQSSQNKCTIWVLHVSSRRMSDNAPPSGAISS